MGVELRETGRQRRIGHIERLSKMIRIREISLPSKCWTDAEKRLIREAAHILRISEDAVRRVVLVRRSVDARKKPDVHVIYTIDVEVSGNEKKILNRCKDRRVAAADIYEYSVPVPATLSANRPVVIGFGPAGMFAALVLAMAGANPLVLERGDDAQTRSRKVREFSAGGRLDPESNVQFGEGGAGTFSDGKLNTGVNNPRIGWILRQFVQAGAGDEILYDARPHVGTDVLVTVVQNLRRRIRELGGEVRFNARAEALLTADGHVTGVLMADGTRIEAQQVILAVGHSARDTFEMLLETGVPMERKPFAMGVRIEHAQEQIDRAQYGAEDPYLPPADYKLVRHLEDRTVYTFCMCPGGYVVAAASEEGGVVTNGMSNHDRGGKNANAALLVSIEPKDIPLPGVLGGMYWQRQIEQAAYALSGSYRAPAQTVGDFLAGKASCGASDVEPTYRPGVHWCDLHEFLPAQISGALEKAIPQLDGSLHGFSAPGAVLTGPETRSSSPVRILRDESRQSALRGLYPAGEGAGYAGGIMSAALDGMLTAEAVLTGSADCRHM